MSRIGKKPVAIPAKVEVKIDQQVVSVKGAKGELTLNMHPRISAKLEDNTVVLERASEEREDRALHGLTRALVNNMVIGVSEGFKRTLEIEGVGYQALLQGNNLNMKLGFSHEVIVEAPAGITFDVPKDSKGSVIIITGIDKQAVGQIAADIRELRPPEPYKGKGIRYEGEHIIRKAGKSGKTGKGKKK